MCSEGFGSGGQGLDLCWLLAVIIRKLNIMPEHHADSGCCLAETDRVPNVSPRIDYPLVDIKAPDACGIETC